MTIRNPRASRSAVVEGEACIPGTDPLAVAGLDYPVQHGQERLRLGTRPVSHRYGQIRRPHVGDIDPGDRQNPVEIVDRLEGLDHRNADNLLVGPVVVVGAFQRHRPRRPEATVAEGRVAAGCDRGDRPPPLS